MAGIDQQNGSVRQGHHRMNDAHDHENLFVLVADRDTKEAVSGVLRRPESIGMRSVQFECRRHPNRDNGCRVEAVDFLRTFRGVFSHALVVFDKDGCGSTAERKTIERRLESDLDRSGWGGCGKAVVIDPELEAWVWADSHEVLECLGWKRGYPKLRSWLRKEGLWSQFAEKPDEPKAALCRTLQYTRRRRTARIYRDIAERVSLTRCRDPSFGKLVTTLRDWFPALP